MTGAVHVCFSAPLGDLPKKARRDPDIVLATIHAAGCFSVFDADTPAMAQMLDYLLRSGRMVRTGGAYPWVNVRVPEMELRALAAKEEA